MSDLKEILRLQQDGDLSAAILLCDVALQDQPSNAQLLYLAGNINASLGKADEALEQYRKLVELAPEVAESHVRLGLLLSSVERHEEAILALTTALGLAPNRVDALSARISSRQSMGDLPAAYADATRLVEIDPKAPSFLLLGSVLVSLRRWIDAQVAFDQAIKLDPDLPEVWYNRGLVFQSLGKMEDAKQSWERAIELRPLYPQANWNLALLLLSQGDFERGWALYESRWLLPGFLGKLGFARPYPRWTGTESLIGKRILVHFEQGYGDTIQLVRYLPQLKARGAMVVLHAPTKLLKVFSSLSGVDRVIDSPAPNAKFDFQIPLMSLPYVLGAKVDNIPWVDPGYLRAHTASVIKWRPVIDSLKGRRVALVWSGNKSPDGMERSIELEVLRPLLETAAVSFVSLQPTVSEGDRRFIEQCPNLHHFEEMHEDFSDAAAIIELVDLVVTIDTSICHLAGAMGKPTWILLPFESDWRWFRDRADSPWYPSARLFRQSEAGQWKGVIADASAELVKKFPQKKRWWAVLGSNQ
jgi:tetratricopeptide (TPR) repeat protein